MAVSATTFPCRLAPLLVWLILIGCGVPTDALQSNVKGSISGMYLVTAIEPPAASPGSFLSIKGVGFGEGIKVLIAGTEVPVSSRSGEKEMTILVPQGMPGMTPLIVSLDGEQSSHNFIRLSSDGTPVMAGVDPKQMCKGQNVYSMAGLLIGGERDCIGEVPLCSAEGQTNCIASEKFPSVSVSGLEDRVVEGQSVAGIEGKAKTESAVYPDCKIDGEQNCVVNGAFAAAETDSVAAKVLSGQSVAGVSGTYAPDFPDAQNVLNSDTVNGAPGTLSLPLPANVLNTSGNYGVGGSGSVPTLTLPPDTSVLASASYGSAGNSHSGQIPARGNWNLGNSFPGAGYYSAVTNVPDIGDIRSGATILGVDGSVVPTPANCSSDGQTACVTTDSFKAANMTIAVVDNIKSGITIAGVYGSYGGGASSTCLFDGATGCMVDGSRFVAADVQFATKGNIRNDVTIAGVKGTYQGGASVSIVQPTGNDDFVIPNGNFLLTFNVFKPGSDPTGTLTLYARSDGSKSGCAGDPATNGWAQIVTGLNETHTSYDWTAIAKGVYFICAKFDNGVNQAYEVSGGKLFARDSTVFVTSTTYIGNGFGGSSGADAICAGAAANAGFPHSSSYKAIISNDSQHARDRVSLGARIFNTKSEQLGTAINFWSGTIGARIYRTDTTTGSVAWTGSGAFGHTTGENCSNWSSSSAGLVGGAGNPEATNLSWIMTAYSSCNTLRALYCMGDR